MKYLRILSVLFSVILVSSAQAQDSKDTTFIVNGVCEMCKFTIENSIDTNGVYSASWNPSTKILKLTYDEKLITLEEINSYINKAGYDTEFTTAPDEAYESLHGCCHYRDEKVIKSHQ